MGNSPSRRLRSLRSSQAQLDDFRDKRQEWNTSDVTAFRRAAADIADSTSDQSVKKLAQELLDVTAKASEAQLAIEGTAKAMRQLSPAALAAVEVGEKFAKAMKKLDDSA